VAGEGPYEGLTLYLHAMRTVYATPEIETDGIIFEGPAPMMVEAVQVPTD
jgi:hypothetical protein